MYVRWVGQRPLLFKVDVFWRKSNSAKPEPDVESGSLPHTLEGLLFFSFVFHTFPLWSPSSLPFAELKSLRSPYGPSLPSGPFLSTVSLRCFFFNVNQLKGHWPTLLMRLLFCCFLALTSLCRTVSDTIILLSFRTFF